MRIIDPSLEVGGVGQPLFFVAVFAVELGCHVKSLIS